MKTEESGSSLLSSDVESSIALQKGSGRPLPEAERSFFEPRFGADFSLVRIHFDAQASEITQTLQAKAFTVGRDIYFGSGQYAPGMLQGRSLLAHELTHVAQQARPGLPARIQRITLGTGAPPATGNWPAMAPGPVPAAEQPLINEAIAMLAEVAQDPDTYDDCHGLFADKCPGGGAASLQTAFNNAILWRLNPANRPTLRGFGSVNGTNIGYTAYVFDMGARELAMTLVHELMHNCGITGPAQHYLANVAKLYCIGPRNRLSGAIGMTGTDLPAGFLVYRRILTEWAGGHLNLTAGGDINVLGLIAATSAAVTDADPTPAEWGSAAIGLQGRTALLWGGDRFGGLRASVDLGVGVGQFALRTPGPEEGPIVAPSLILQVGAGAEFYLPVGTKAKPVSVDVALRLAQPRNSEAERIQTYVISVGGHF